MSRRLCPVTALVLSETSCRPSRLRPRPVLVVRSLFDRWALFSVLFLFGPVGGLPTRGSQGARYYMTRVIIAECTGTETVDIGNNDDE